MSFYIITTLLPDQMECLWLLAWKQLANKATHGRIQQKEKHGLTWNTDNINIFSRMGKTSWNSVNHNLELLIQILQEEIDYYYYYYFLSETAVDDISDSLESWRVSWSPPEQGIYSSVVFQAPFSESKWLTNSISTDVCSCNLHLRRILSFRNLYHRNQW